MKKLYMGSDIDSTLKTSDTLRNFGEVLDIIQFTVNFNLSIAHEKQCYRFWVPVSGSPKKIDVCHSLKLSQSCYLSLGIELVSEFKSFYPGNFLTYPESSRQLNSLCFIFFLIAFKANWLIFY